MVPKTGLKGTREGQSGADRRAKWVKPGPQLPEFAPFPFPKGPRPFFEQNHLGPFLGRKLAILGSRAVGGSEAPLQPGTELAHGFGGLQRDTGKRRTLRVL